MTLSSYFVVAALVFLGCAIPQCTAKAQASENPMIIVPLAKETVKETVRKLMAPTMVQIYGPITDETSQEIIQKLLEEAATHDYVTVEINTPGGGNVAGFAVAKAIEDLGKPVYCIVDGEAQSYGFYLLQSCTIRTMTKRSFLMMHESVYPKLTLEYVNRFDLMEYVNTLEAVSFAMAEHYAKRMGLSVEIIKVKTNHTDWHMLWGDAVKYHAVDYVFDSTQEAVLALDLINKSQKIKLDSETRSWYNGFMRVEGTGPLRRESGAGGLPSGLRVPGRVRFGITLGGGSHGNA